MYRQAFIIICILSLFATRVDAQCVDAGPAMLAICQGGTTAGLGGKLLGDATSATWSSSDGGTFAPSANDLDAKWTPPAIFQGTATLTLTGSGGTICAPTSVSKTVVVIQLPLAPGGSSTQTFCSITVPTVSNLSALGSGIKWYLLATGGISLVPSAPLTTGTYYASQTVNSCEGDLRLAVSVTVTDPPAPTGAATQPFCAINLPTIADLAASGSGVKWYSLPVGGSPLAPSTGLATSTYYATQTISGCESDTRLAVSVTVSDPGPPTGAASQSFCSSSLPSLASIAVTGSTIKWYSLSSGGSLLPGTTNLVNGTTYYASQTVGSCESDLRLAVTVSLITNNTINRISTTGTDAQTVCSNTSITNIIYATTGATGASVTGLPSGVTGNWAVNTVTISGIPTIPGPFNYTVNLTGGCGVATTTGSIIVTALPVATFSYASSPYCSDASNPFPTFSGGGVAGTFSSTAGLNFVNALTGEVNLGTSTPGTYTVTNLIAAAGNCGIVSATSSIRITAPPAASISYSGSPWCGSAGVKNVTRTGTAGGTYTAAPAGLIINAVTGAITTATSTAGIYNVVYNMPTAGGCGSSTASTTVEISSTPTAPIVGAITAPTCGVATGSVVLNGLPASGNWTLTRSPGAVTTNGTGSSFTVTGLAAGNYAYTVTNAEFCTSSVSGNVVINAQPASPATPLESVDCSLGFGHANVTVLSPIGVGLEYSIDGGTYQTLLSFTNVVNGSHYLSVRNPAGCTTPGSLFSVTCGCINPPTVALSSNTGSTCGITPVTVAGNTFGGTATSVLITDNGAGIVTPASANTKPFSFTYIPTAADGGKIVIITVTTNNPLGAPCAAGVATYSLTVNATPAEPAIGVIAQPTCSVGTGSVTLNGLPALGTWTLMRNPGSIITSGNGTTTTVSGLVPATYTFIVTSAEGCTSSASANAIVTTPPSAPAAPVVGTLTQPTCAISTGSVVLSGLPAGNWILTRSPGAVATPGTGTSITIPVLSSGTYTYTVTNSAGCISPPSSNVVVNVQPGVPPAPTVGTITPPTCILSTGSVLLTGLPSAGTWTLIRYPGTITTTGTGTSSTIPGLTLGTYNFTVTTADGCLSVPSLNVIIPAQPITPTAPVIGTITQPTLAVPTGSASLSGLPSTGNWIVTLLPGGTTTSGTGTSRTIANLAGGVFTFTVTNSAGCISPESNTVTISTPGTPVLVITDPHAVCSPATIDITNPTITTGSTPGLIYTYWTNSGATLQYNTPATATTGTYYIKGTTVSGYFNIKPVTVTVDHRPVPNAGVDQSLDYQFSTTLDGSLLNTETGVWSVISGTAEFVSVTDPKTTVNELSAGDNYLLWSLKRGVCPIVADTVRIVVNNLKIPSLITPNMDGRNDFFVLRGLATLGKAELVIFDRRGAQVFKSTDYNNLWDGVDYNNNPLPDDTYFYVLKTANGKSLSGYIVIRR